MKITKFFALLCAIAVGFVACEKKQAEPTPEPSGNITLSADTTAVSIGETVTFKVTDAAGQDVTAAATIYDPDLNVVEGGKFKAVASGSFSFFATVGSENSNYLTISVLAEAPEIPEDPQPANLKFNHRALVIDHTGVGCGYCPVAMDELLALSKTEWHDHYNEVTCHAGTYAGGDPARSTAADMLNSFQSNYFRGYPSIIVNFYSKCADYGKNSIINALKSVVNKEGADVGISLAVAGDATQIYCTAQIKSAYAREYKVNAWLLENDIYSPTQANATKDYHKVYNFALRNSSEPLSRTDVAGVSIGTLEAGQTFEYAKAIPITNVKWAWENMGVLVIVSAKDGNNRWDVVNTAYCPVGESKAFEYVE